MEEGHADIVLLARTMARENPSVEDASFFFEYRLVLPDDKLVDYWRRVYTRARGNWALYGEQTCALQHRRIDTLPSGQVQDEWINLRFAKTIWQLIWESVELRNSDIESCHPLTPFFIDAYRRVDEIDQMLSQLTERGLHEDFERRFQQRTSRLRNQERKALIRNEFLQEYSQVNTARLEQCSALQAERERLVQGVDAPVLIVGERTIPVASEEQ